MENMTHLISLGVGTTGSEEHAQTYQDLCELARNLAVSHGYVSVTSQVVGDDEDEIGCGDEHLHYDEQTLGKVRSAINKAIRETSGGPVVLIDAIILEMQNAGILFRERSQ